VSNRTCTVLSAISVHGECQNKEQNELRTLQAKVVNLLQCKEERKFDTSHYKKPTISPGNRINGTNITKMKLLHSKRIINATIKDENPCDGSYSERSNGKPTLAKILPPHGIKFIAHHQAP
jgi:hypothetical protein